MFSLVFAIILVVIIGGFAIKKNFSGKKDDGAKSQSTQALQDPKQQAEIEAQLKQLDELQKQQNVQPPTQEQVDEQLKQLDELQKQQNVQPPTQEQISEQLKQLDALQKANKK